LREPERLPEVKTDFEETTLRRTCQLPIVPGASAIDLPTFVWLTPPPGLLTRGTHGCTACRRLTDTGFYLVTTNARRLVLLLLVDRNGALLSETWRRLRYAYPWDAKQDGNSKSEFRGNWVTR